MTQVVLAKDGRIVDRDLRAERWVREDTVNGSDKIAAPQVFSPGGRRSERVRLKQSAAPVIIPDHVHLGRADEVRIEVEPDQSVPEDLVAGHSYPTDLHSPPS